MAEIGKAYRRLNPVGIQPAVETYPLAARLDTLDGKTLHFSICDDPDVMVTLEKRLKSQYPEVNRTSKPRWDMSPILLTDEEMGTTDGIVLGMCW